MEIIFVPQFKVVVYKFEFQLKLRFGSSLSEFLNTTQFCKQTQRVVSMKLTKVLKKSINK